MLDWDDALADNELDEVTDTLNEAARDLSGLVRDLDSGRVIGPEALADAWAQAQSIYAEARAGGTELIDQGDLDYGIDEVTSALSRRGFRFDGLECIK